MEANVQRVLEKWVGAILTAYFLFSTSPTPKEPKIENPNGRAAVHAKMPISCARNHDGKKFEKSHNFSTSGTYYQLLRTKRRQEEADSDDDQETDREDDPLCSDSSLFLGFHKFLSVSGDKEHENWLELFHLMQDKCNEDKHFTAKTLLTHASYFLSWFMIRKVLSDTSDKKKAAEAMDAVIRFCVKEKILPDGEETKQTWERISGLLEWKWQARGHESDFDARGLTDKITDPVKVVEVKQNGFVMAGYWRGCDAPETIFLHLPPDVAAMGVPGMEFSCMGLRRSFGIWSPYGMYGNDDMVYANVYPPSNTYAEPAPVWGRVKLDTCNINLFLLLNTFELENNENNLGSKPRAQRGWSMRDPRRPGPGRASGWRRLKRLTITLIY
eukprot:g33754.t1